MCASGIVYELKNDLENVKSQLDQIVDKNNDSLNNRNNISAKQVYQMKTENKKLRKELDQKKVLQQSSIKQLEKLNIILVEYEKKVTLLHQQSVKSSKVMKQMKEKFCSCLKDKDKLIKQLKHENEVLQKNLTEKENQCVCQNKQVEDLQKELQEKNEQNNILSDTNQNFCECIKMLEAQLENSTKENNIYKKLEKVRNILIKKIVNLVKRRSVVVVRNTLPSITKKLN